MTQIHRPSRPALATVGPGDPPATRTRARVVAVVLAGSALTGAAALLLRPMPADDLTAYAVVAPARDAAWTFGLVAGLSIALAYACLGLAVCLLARGRGAATATAGAFLTGIGALGFASGFFALTTVLWYSTSPVLDPSTSEALVDHVGTHAFRAFAPQLVGYLACTAGLALLAVALWRSRSVPRWLPVAMPTGVVLAILAGTGMAYDVVHAVLMGTFVAVAWFLWDRVGRRPSPE